MAIFPQRLLRDGLWSDMKPANQIDTQAGYSCESKTPWSTLTG
jgi:hypothetical protein